MNLEGQLSAAALLFSETPSRIVLSAADSNVNQIIQIASEHNVAATVIGRTRGERLAISVNGELAIDHPVTEVESTWRGLLPRLLEIPSLLAAEEK